MDQRVALLRGINVGKAKRVAMADLKALLEGMGLKDVRTLLNSGNAVFTVPAGKAARLAERIAEGIEARLGVKAGVIVVTAATWHAVVLANPMQPVPDPSRYLVMFPPHEADLAMLQAVARGQPPQLFVGAHTAYVWCPDGVLKSTVAGEAGKALKHTATARNWATVLKVQALLQPPGSG